jgi:hypothetical protein
MDCRQVRDWLLDAEDPRPEFCGRADVAQHMAGCAVCRAVADRLSDLEETWRTLPVPARSEQAKAEFLARLPDLEQATSCTATADGLPSASICPAGSVSPAAIGTEISGRRLSRRFWLRGGLVAAASCCVIVAGSWMLLAGREAQASHALLSELVDWNLRLTEAESATDREHLYAEQATRLQSAIDATRQPDDHAALDRAFMENGAWLSAHRDPAAEATRFDGLAARLLELARDAGQRRAYRQMNRLLQQYNRLMEAGINPNIKRAELAGVLDFEHQRNLERLALSDQRHIQELTSLLAEVPNASRDEIERALKLRANRPEIRCADPSRGKDKAHEKPAAKKK